MIHNFIDFDVTKNSCEKIESSSSPSEAEREISQVFSNSFTEQHGEEVNRLGYERVNFDLAIKKDIIIINKAFAIRENGSVDVIDIKHKHRMKGHSISTRVKRKVSKLAMSIHIPIPLILYFEEMELTFKENILFKLGFATVFGALFSVLKIPFEDMLIGFSLFLIVALIDIVLGVMPNIKDQVDEPMEHKLQAKFWKFASNVIAMVGLYYFHLLTVTMLPKESWTTFIPHNIHYFGIAFITGVYCISIMKYIAIANNTKMPLPDSVMDRFKKK